MSFEIASQIVDMYMQTNTRRINNAMESAYKEALSQYQSEQEARNAALQVLKIEQSSFDDYLKLLNRNMKDLRKGQIDLARRKQEALEYNKRQEFREREINRKERFKTSEYNTEQRIKTQRQNILQRYNREVDAAKLKASTAKESERLEAKKQEAEKELDKLNQAARIHEMKVTQPSNVLSTSINTKVSKLAPLLQSFSTDSNIKTKLGTAMGDLFDELKKGIEETKESGSSQGLIRTENDYEFVGTREEYKQAAIRDKVKASLMSQFETSYTGQDKTAQKKEFETLIDDFLNSTDENTKTLTGGKSGLFSNVQKVSPSEVKRRGRIERELYEYVNTKRIQDTLNLPDASLKIPPPPTFLPMERKPYVARLYRRDVPEEGTNEKDYINKLREQAEPVYAALRADDDTPFVLTKEEVGQVGEAAVDAYKQLQIERTMTPLISEEERRLLDPLALERQLNIMRQQQRVREINPRLQSQGEIRSRAGEILEGPVKQPTKPKLNPLEQMYYSTQPQSLKLSHRSDKEVESLGKPEELGVLKYKQVFDPVNNTFMQGNTYQSVINDLQKAYPKKEEQYRAVSAFNSRVMALERSRAPTYFADGTPNQEALEALQSFDSKEK